MIWRFGDYELDESRFELRHVGERVPIAPKPLAVLLHLARRYPASVSHAELHRVIWPGVMVTNGSLARAVRAVRRAFGQGKDDEGVIRTVRGRGYALGDSLCAETGRELTAPAPTATPLVGRIAELARIETALESVEAGSGRLLFISGEAGIGKTRLLDELTTRALARRLGVVSGSCREDEGSPPYWPWAEIVGELAAHDNDPILMEALRRLNLSVDPGGYRSPPLAGGEARFRLFHDVTRALREAGRKRPIVLTIEDLHWAGAASLQLLRFAGRSLGRSPVMIVATLRRAGPPSSPELEAAVGELAALSHALPELRLAGLSRDEIVAYCRTIAGWAPPAEAVEYLEVTAGGNPLFLRELVPLLGTARAQVSSSVVHIVRSQFERLSQPARELIEMAAVIGREFSLGLLTRTTRFPAKKVLDLVDEAGGENLVDWAGEERRSLRFRHDVVRAAIIDGLATSRRVELHRRVAAALAVGELSDRRLAALAYHYTEAIPRLGPEKAIHYSTRAAEAARRALDFESAADHYRQALMALETDGGGRTSAQRCDLLLALGEVLDLSGRSSESRAAIVAAAELGRALRSWPRLARAAIAATVWERGAFADPLLLQLVEDALQAVGRRRNEWRARLLATLAVLRKLTGDEAAASALIEDAVDLAKRLGDPALLCDVLAHRLLEMQVGVPGNQPARLALTVELREAAENAGSMGAILQCRRQRIALFLELGAGAELDEEIELFARDSAEARCRQHYAVAFRANRAVIRGDFEEACRLIDEAESLADPSSPEERLFTPIGQRIDMPPEFRDNEAIYEAVQRLTTDFPWMHGWYSARALVALDTGRLDVVRATLEQMAADDFAMMSRDMSYTLVLCGLARVSWRLGETRHATALYERLLAHAGTTATSGIGLVFQGPVDWHLGVLALLLGRRRVAARHFEESLAICDRLGAGPWHATTELTYASLLAGGGAGERERAAALAASAAKAAAGFGMDSLRGEAGRLRSRLCRGEARRSG